MKVIDENVRMHYRLAKLEKEAAELLTLDIDTKKKLSAAIAAKKKEVKDALPKGK